MRMTKTQVYMPAEELEALHAVARRRKRSTAELVREAVRRVWLAPEPAGPVALTTEPIRATSMDHASAFDEP